jgi:hypothetical protein
MSTEAGEVMALFQEASARLKDGNASPMERSFVTAVVLSRWRGLETAAAVTGANLALALACRIIAELRMLNLLDEVLGCTLAAETLSAMKVLEEVHALEGQARRMEGDPQALRDLLLAVMPEVNVLLEKIRGAVKVESAAMERPS